MQLHPTARILDSTKIQCWHNCPRRFLYEYILGWKPVIPSIHLFFGECFHLGMEVFMRKGLSLDSVEEASQTFLKRWREKIPQFSDEDFSPKTPANALRAFLIYYKTYLGIDDFKVLGTEISGSIPIDSEGQREIYYKIDAVCQSESLGIFALEHKTCGYYDKNYQQMFEMLTQTDVYTHVLHCNFQDVPIFGCVINAINIKNPPRIKKDGEMYANETEISPKRFYVPKTNDYMKSWLVDINNDFDDIDYQLSSLEDGTYDDLDILKLFNRRTTHCVNKYGLCPYHSYCKIYNNPIKVKEVPSEFTVEYWDPRTREDVK